MAPHTKDTNPGSFADFVALHPLEQELVASYGKALTAHRLARATLLGVDPEDLHNPYPPAGYSELNTPSYE